MGKTINNINVYNSQNPNPQYVRVQKGHSIIVWLILSLITAGVGFIVMLYFTFSKNHFWHL